MPVESVYDRLEPLLPLVRKPVQYVGGELNAVVKDWDAADVRWALMYPDAYEVGVANQGIQILYEVLNGRDGLLTALAVDGGVYVPRFYDVDYLPDGRIRRVAPNRPEAPFTVEKHTVMDLDEWQYPARPIVPIAESVHERFSVEIFRGCTRGCRFCQAGMITQPVRERSITAIENMVEQGLTASSFDEIGLLSLSSADHSEINQIATGLADRYENTSTRLSLPSTRVDAFNVTLADELSRNGRRSGLTFPP